MAPFNRLLETLTPASRARLLASAKLLEFPQRSVLLGPNGPSGYVYFLVSGLASYVVTVQEGGSAEIGMAGSEGMLGSAGLATEVVPVASCMMQSTGSGYRIPLAEMNRLFEESVEIRSLVLQSMQQHTMMLSQIAACNRLHMTTERLARWLLSASAHLGADAVSLTQDSLSQMLGTRRTTVALVAGSLQRSGLIQYKRGRVCILDRERLTEAACDCYGIVQRLSTDLYNNPFAAK